MKKTFMALLGLALVASALVVAPTTASAQAGNAFAGIAGCQVDLPTWPSTAPTSAPNCGGGTLPTDGLALGAGTIGGAPVVCVPGCAFAATNITYNEPCLIPIAPPPVGFATGNLTINGNNVGGFNWTRVGLTAVLLPVNPGQSAGVAAFVPDLLASQAGGCAPAISAPLRVHVVGAAVGSDSL